MHPSRGETSIPEEGAAEMNAVEPTDKLPLLPCLHRMRDAEAVQRDVALGIVVADPRAIVVFPLSTGAHDGFEGVVDANLEPARANDAREPGGNVKIVEWNDTARIGREPGDLADSIAIGKMPSRYARSARAGSSAVDDTRFLLG